MMKMAKTIAKALKGIVRPKTTTVKVAIPQRDTVPTVPAKVDNIPGLVPTRDELIERMTRTLQAEVDRKLKAFVDAVENYPCRYVVDEWLDSDDNPPPPAEMEDLVFSLESLLGVEIDYWIWGGDEYDALCAAIEYHQQDGDEITIELVTAVMEDLRGGRYELLPDVDNDEDLGAAIVRRFWRTQNCYGLGWLLESVDDERLGENWRNNEGGMYTSRGYFQFGRITF